MNRSAFAICVLVLSLLGAAPPRGGLSDCERHASFAACDPETGYIAGRNGPCRPSDVRCIEAEWRRRGQIRYYPEIGMCGRSHEDGGTIEPCPPGVGPGPGSSVGGPQPSSGGNRAGTPRGGAGNRRTTPGGRSRRNQPPPPPPPPPPTLDETLATCPDLPSPRLYRNPDHEGVTGMETWLWAERHAPVTSTATIRGYPVTCRAVAERWTWRTGDGTSFTRAHPGSEPPHHAAEHVYRRKGSYTQRLVVHWRLETGQGTGATTREATRPYRVVEVRGALVE